MKKRERLYKQAKKYKKLLLSMLNMGVADIGGEYCGVTNEFHSYTVDEAIKAHIYNKWYYGNSSLHKS